MVRNGRMTRIQTEPSSISGNTSRCMHAPSLTRKRDAHALMSSRYLLPLLWTMT